MINSLFISNIIKQHLVGDMFLECCDKLYVVQVKSQTLIDLTLFIIFGGNIILKFVEKSYSYGTNFYYL